MCVVVLSSKVKVKCNLLITNNKQVLCGTIYIIRNSLESRHVRVDTLNHLCRKKIVMLKVKILCKKLY